MCGAWKPGHVPLARAVSAIARAQGATADRGAVQEVQLAIAAKPDAIDVGFWPAILGYAPMADDNAAGWPGRSEWLIGWLVDSVE